MVVFSGELDKVLASFVIANGAASMGSEVTMFFTFWGLNALRKGGAQAGGKGLLDRMFGWMMPNGASALKLSQMHMMGMGTALMKHVMKSKNVDTLELLMGQAKAAGVKLVACSMSMDVMGLKREELIDGLQVGGVATFLGESQGADMTLFI
jgi:peroxiredoxin family protein